MRITCIVCNKEIKEGQRVRRHMCPKCYYLYSDRPRKDKEYYEQNKEKKVQWQKEYYKANKDKCSSWHSTYYRVNKDLRNFKDNRRKAAKLNAIPSWLNEEQLDQIKAKYYLSKWLSEFTGMKFHVDHIIPLQSEDVCGLHVPWSLQILRAEENLSKSNKVLA